MLSRVGGGITSHQRARRQRLVALRVVPAGGVAVQATEQQDTADDHERLKASTPRPAPPRRQV
jgi:hypothetical protein